MTGPNPNDKFQPIEEPFKFARRSAADVLRQLRDAGTRGIGAAFQPRYPGDGRYPTIHTHKPGAFRTRGQD